MRLYHGQHLTAPQSLIVLNNTTEDISFLQQKGMVSTTIRRKHLQLLIVQPQL